MSDVFSQFYQLLVDVILPNLKGIQASQAEQRLQTDRLNRNIEEFRAEMQVRFAEMRADIAACRAQVEDAMVTIRESEAANAGYPASRGKKTLVH